MERTLSYNVYVSVWCGMVVCLCVHVHACMCVLNLVEDIWNSSTHLYVFFSK